jgi:hypothetical protein
MRFLALSLCFGLLLCASCKKENNEESAPPPAEPAPTSAKSTPKTAATPNAAPIEIPGAKGDTPLRRDNKSDATVCMRACNKAQQCGTAGGNVTACVETCQRVLKATEGDEARLALGFRAQEQCADLACSQFDQCVGKALIGEKMLAEHPSLAPDTAEAMCRALCDQEKKCHSQAFERRPGGMAGCLVACKSVLINPSADMALNRAVMSHTHGCLTDDCSAFEVCVRKGFTQTDPAK